MCRDPVWGVIWICLERLRKVTRSINKCSRRASWSSGQSFWLLITRYRVWFPALPWGFSLWGRITVVTMVWVVSRFRLKVETSSTRSQISINSDWNHERSPRWRGPHHVMESTSYTHRQPAHQLIDYLVLWLLVKGGGEFTVTCTEPSVPIIVNLYDPNGICVTFSWPASSGCWCVSITGAESSCERKSIAEYRLQPVRTSVSKYAIIAALERKLWRILSHITPEMGLSEKIILETLRKITCLRTTTHGSHICFQNIAYYNCSFSYHFVTNAMQMSSF